MNPGDAVKRWFKKIPYVARFLGVVITVGLLPNVQTFLGLNGLWAYVVAAAGGGLSALLLELALRRVGSPTDSAH